MKFTLFFGFYVVAEAAASRIPAGRWRDLAPIPSVRQEHVTVATSPSSFAILGGIVPNGDSWVTTDLVQFYDIAKNSWRPAPPLPVPLNHPNGASVGNKIYLLGGLLTAPDGNWVGTPDSWVYNKKPDVWASLPATTASAARGSAAVGVHNGIIYLAGGLTVLELVLGGQQGTVDTVTAFDTVSEKWIPLPPAARRLPAPRDHAGAAVVGHTFYVLGGRDHGGEEVRDTVFALDLHNLAAGWVTKKGRMPTARGGLAAATIGTKVYTFGGEGNPNTETGVFNETEVYDTVGDSWTRLAPMKLPRHGTSAVAIGGRVYVPGGG
ncbi:hypothetical protein B0T14DRAFT_451896, partial [Immersiella caudata]